MKLNKAIEIVKEHLKIFGVGNSKFSLALDLVVTNAEDYESEESRKAVCFVNHVKEHFEEQHPEWEVKCTICDKTISELWGEYYGKEVN